MTLPIEAQAPDQAQNPQPRNKLRTLTDKIGGSVIVNELRNALAAQERLENPLDVAYGEPAFAEALQLAQGPNKEILRIMEEVSHLPSQEGASPLRGTVMLEADKNRHLKRLGNYHFGASKDDRLLMPKSVPLTSEMSNLLLSDDTSVTIETLSVTSDALLNTDEHATSIRSTLFINDHLPRKVRVDINEAGVIESVGMTNPITTGYAPVAFNAESLTNTVNSFLQGVHAPAEETAPTTTSPGLPGPR